MPDYTYPLHIDLGDGLVMRSVASEEEIRRVAVANRKSFQEDELEVLTLDIYRKLPGMRWEDILYVEDTATGEIVSSLSLLPERWLYEDVELKVAELGVVGTHPDYRGRGLIREQMKVFAAKLEQGGYDLSNIQGIPFFYRQFGYDYALPLNTGCQLSLAQVPDAKEETSGAITIRLLAEDEVGVALKLYDQMAADWCVKVARDEATWRFPEQVSDEYPDKVQSFLVLDEEQPLGYFRLRTHLRDGKLSCREITPMSYEATLAALRLMKKKGSELGAHSIELQVAPDAPAMTVVKGLGGSLYQPYAWQVRIPDRARFLRTIAPVLEQRLAGSAMAGLTGTLHINFYVETVELRFERGRIVQVQSLGKGGRRDIRLPPYPAVRLLTGYQSWQEIRAFRPDLGCAREWELTLEALFPKRPSCICSTI